MKTANIFLLAMALFISTGGFQVNAAIIDAESCDQYHIQAAINKAADGDTVFIPEGDCTWVASTNNHPPNGSPFNQKTPSILIWEKNITLMGAGKGKTVITDDTRNEYGETAIYARLSQNATFRISKMTFRLAVTDIQDRTSLIIISGAGKDWRIDNCAFESELGMMNGVFTRGEVYGLIDNCDFLNTGIIVKFGLGEQSVASWKRPLTLGSRDAVYIEKCEFRKTHFGNAVDNNGGGRYVFRYNKLYNDYCEAHSLQNSYVDNQGILRIERGARSYEIYNNEFFATDQGPGVYMAVRVRAGTGVIFNNKVRNLSGDPYDGFGAVDNKRTYEEQGALGVCDGNNPLDGNTPGQQGYPCLDQIGRSTDHGPAVNDRLPQASDPLYAWGNTVDGQPAGFIAINDPNKREHIQEGRDFVNSDKPKPGYDAYIFPHPLAQNDPDDGDDTPDGSSSGGGGGGGCFLNNLPE